MNKPRILITVRGGVIQHIASTTKDIEIQIVDYDNLEQADENAINTLSETQEPDLIMRKWDMETSIDIIKKQFKSKIS